MEWIVFIHEDLMDVPEILVGTRGGTYTLQL